MNDFLNDTNSFKNKLVNYGLSESASNAYLKSEIRILEVC